MLDRVTNKMHVSSKKCPQATSQERKVYVSLVLSIVENNLRPQCDKAEDYLKKARALDPTSAVALKASFINLYMQQKYEKSLIFSHKWLEHHPTDVGGHLHMASALYQLHQKLDSLTYYEKALSFDARKPAARRKLFWSGLHCKRSVCMYQ